MLNHTSKWTFKCTLCEAKLETVAGLMVSFVEKDIFFFLKSGNYNNFTIFFPFFLRVGGGARTFYYGCTFCK